MNALLNIRDNQFNIVLQSVYFSPKCNIFYIGLLVFALLLILVTIVMGIQVTETALFMVAEGLVNLLITADFGFRWKLAGRRKFFRGNSGKVRWWNWVDLCVVIVCNFMFVGACILPNKTVKEAVVEGFEETFLVLWCVFSLMRMVLIAKKHRLA